MTFNVALRIVVVLVFVFGIYGLYKSYDFLRGPKILIEYPKNNQTVDDSYLEVRGVAKNISALYFDGRKIFTDQQGNFKEGLLLAKGYNIIEIAGKDKFNRDIKKTLEIVLK